MATARTVRPALNFDAPEPVVTTDTNASALFPEQPIYARKSSKKASGNLPLLVGVPVVAIVAGGLIWAMSANRAEAPTDQKSLQTAVADTPAPKTEPLPANAAATPAPIPQPTELAANEAPAPAAKSTAPRAAAPVRATRRAAPAAAPDASTASANVSATVPVAPTVSAPAVPEPAPLVVPPPAAPQPTPQPEPSSPM